MYQELIFHFLSFAMGVLGTVESLGHESARKRRIGLCIIVVLILSLGLQIYFTVTKNTEIEDINAFLRQSLNTVDEASGGTLLGDAAYVVDDDSTSLYKCKFEAKQEGDEKGKYSCTEIPLVDERADRQPWSSEDDLRKPFTLKKNDVEDFEAAANYGGHIYLVTSQANSDKGEEESKRQWFLEVTPEGKIVHATNRLRSAIRKFFEAPPQHISTNPIPPFQEDNLEVMHVEGLAIDEAGHVFFGFRAPMVGRRALVLRASLQDLFTDEPRFDKSYALSFPYRKGAYGVLSQETANAIVSMEYDPQTKRIMILTNNPRRKEVSPTLLWSWTPDENEAEPSPPVLCEGPEFKIPISIFGKKQPKPEVLLIDGQHVTWLLDAEGHGGVRIFPREAFNIPK